MLIFNPTYAEITTMIFYMFWITLAVARVALMFLIYKCRQDIGGQLFVAIAGMWIVVLIIGDVAFTLPCTSHQLIQIGAQIFSPEYCSKLINGG